jgi:hypothetical protein
VLVLENFVLEALEHHVAIRLHVMRAMKVIFATMLIVLML